MNCRFCGEKDIEMIMDLGLQPPSNSLVEYADEYKPHMFLPLQVGVCRKCWLMQTFDTVGKETFFNGNYPYYSGQSKAWVEHCEQFAEFATSYFSLNSESKILEVASNDGTGLLPFKKLDCVLKGIDPATGPAKVAQEAGIDTDIAFLDRVYANTSYEKYDLIIARNVLAHVPDLNDFVQCIRHLLYVEGTVVFEFPSLLNLLKFNQFDTIYHEHYSYLSFNFVHDLLTLNGFNVYNVEELWTHGGSYRVYATRNGDVHPEFNVRETFEKEMEFGIEDIVKYHIFAKNAKFVKMQFLKFLILNESSVILGYGAAAKASTFLNYCGVRSDLLEAVVDSSEHKVGKMMPGSGIPIISESELERIKPDCIIIFPWNFKESFLERLKYCRSWYCEFYTFIPKLEKL
jgi:SAM-dependent methyltransferase